jgi:lysophospholipase L1-like esterase
MTTNPSHARWETYKELEDAVKTVAAERGVAFVDVAGAFRAAGKTPDEALKGEYWVWDKVHLGPKGQEVARDAVLRTLCPIPGGEGRVRGRD